MPGAPLSWPHASLVVPGDLKLGRRTVASVGHSGSPIAAVAAVGVVIAALALLGDVKTTWSFSAFSVLIYHAVTNLAALPLPRERRLYSPWVAWTGLAACLFLAFCVEREIWLMRLGLIAAGLIWHFVANRILQPASDGSNADLLDEDPRSSHRR